MGESLKESLELKELINYIKEIKERGLDLNEEQTKQYFILPLLSLLGYKTNRFEEFIPEYIADFGTKQGEKVDYAILIDGQPIVLIEAKRLMTQLNNKHASKLFRYFSTKDAKLGMLTNGDDYWIFTDTEKDNVMDMEPYFKFRLSEIDAATIDKLESYKRDSIEKIRIHELAQNEKIESVVSEMIDGIFKGDITNETVKMIMDTANVQSYSKVEIERLIRERVYKITNRQNGETQSNIVEQEIKQEATTCTKEYTYNKTKTFKFVSVDYIILFGQKMFVKTAKNIMKETVEYLLKSGKLTVEQLLSIKSLCASAINNNIWSPYRLKFNNYYISTNFSYSQMMVQIEKLMKAAGASDKDLIIKFN